MADFKKAQAKMLELEGGFKLHNVAGDRGGLTFAGIASASHPDWEGWELAKANENDLALVDMVGKFYKAHYWDKIRGDDIVDQGVAQVLYFKAVNSGVKSASKQAQAIVNALADGYIGDKSIAAINSFPCIRFVAEYNLASINHYREICNNDKSQRRFLLGWLNRIYNSI